MTEELVTVHPLVRRRAVTDRLPRSAPEAVPYWERKSLEEMSDVEWEALCDGCGRCCLQKLEDEDSNEVHFTSVSCHMLDTSTCRCRQYGCRHSLVPDCLTVSPLDAEKLHWLPPTCAYRRLAEGAGLPDWHPLITGDSRSVKRAGVGMNDRCTSEREVPLELWVERIIELDPV